MAHAFDTGLSRAQRTLIRDGVVELLSGLVAPTGYLRTVIPWGGIVRGYTDEIGQDLLLAAFNGRAPSIAVALGDRVADAAGMGGFNFKGTIELVLYHYSNHPRSVTDGRTKLDASAVASDIADPGLDIMMEHAEELLIGQRLGGTSATNPVGQVTRSTPTIKQIVPTREEELVTTAQHTLWAQRYAVTVSRTIDPHRTITQMLEEIRTVIRPTDEAAEDLTPPEVLELQNTTVDYVEPPPEDP